MFDELFEETSAFFNPNTVRAGECKIYIDTQEGHVIDSLTRILHGELERNNLFVQRLAVGDYLIESPDGTQEVIIERKSVDDLVASMKDGRLSIQVPELLDQENSFLTIVGDPYKMDAWERTNFKSQDSVTRLITGITLKKSTDGNKLPSFILPNHRQLAVQIDYIARLLEDGKLIRIGEKPTRQMRYGKKINHNDPMIIRNTRLSQLARIPKCGKKKATAIMNHFDWDYKAIQNATIPLLIQVDGVGKVLAERIWKVYNE